MRLKIESRHSSGFFGSRSSQSLPLFVQIGMQQQALLEDFCMLRALLLDEELDYDTATMSDGDIAFWRDIEANDDTVL